MIKWYKPSEKVPEDRAKIVIYGSAYHEIDFYEVEYDAKDYLEDNDYVWAYASDFNFLKDEK